MEGTTGVGLKTMMELLIPSDLAVRRVARTQVEIGARRGRRTGTALLEREEEDVRWTLEDGPCKYKERGTHGFKRLNVRK